MLRILSISILLTIVYSWEDFRRTIKVVAAGLLKKDPGYYYVSRLDQMVSTLVLLATIPFGLTYYLVSTHSTSYKLFMLALQLLVFALLAAGSRSFLFWINEADEFKGHEKIIPYALSIAGLFSPVLHLFSHSYSQARVLAKFAFIMSLPALVGLLLTSLLHYSAPAGEYLPNMDQMVLLLVGALFIRITIDFLEKYFRILPVHTLVSYFRIILGIALAASLTLGLV